MWWVLPYIGMNQPQVYTWPPSQIPLPPPSPTQPSGSSQCTSFECPVSCIELGLVIYFTYGNIHVSVLFSQIIPLSPSPTESKSMFFIYVFFFCFAHWVVIIIFLNSIYMHSYTVLVFFFLTSLCVIGSSFIYLIKTDSNVFFLIAVYYV